MRILINEYDFNSAVCIIENTISTYLLNTMLSKDFGEEFYSIIVNKKMNKREKSELLVEVRGIDLFTGKTEETIEFKKQLLHGVPSELVEELYLRHPSMGRNIMKVGYMYSELAEKKWIAGKGYARDFVETIGFPEIFAGLPGDRKSQKRTIEEIPPKLATPSLKPYQVKMKNKILAILNGDSLNRCCMISLPTGGGKTRVAVEAFLEWMQRRFEENKYLVWIAQSEELCEQCISCIEQIWSSTEFILPLRVYRYFSGFEPSMEELCGVVVVCNIQKIYSQLKTENKMIVKTILKHTGALIIDEAHRASTEMYDVILDLASKLTDERLFPICGLSATPGRTKIEEEGKKLINRFEANLIMPEFDGDDVQYRSCPIKYFKDKKYLSITKHIVYANEKEYELTEHEVEKMGKGIDAEYPNVFLKRLARDIENNRRILKRIFDIPKGQPTLIYTCTVEQARQFTWCMLHKGRSAAYIDSDTNRNIRRNVIVNFKQGNIQFLFNYGVLTTGFDAPKVENIVLARPIRSEILYEQIIGRGIRGTEFGGTEFCTIIDFFDNILIQGVPQSFERFKQYWDYDANNHKINYNMGSDILDDFIEKIYIAEKVGVCPICQVPLNNNVSHYKKNEKDKKLIVRSCECCNKRFVTSRFYMTETFPKEYFDCIQI